MDDIAPTITVTARSGGCAQAPAGLVEHVNLPVPEGLAARSLR